MNIKTLHTSIFRVFCFTAVLFLALTPSLSCAEGENEAEVSILIDGEAMFAPIDPCIEPPYDYEYCDDHLSVLIRKYTEKINGKALTYFVADVQTTEANGLRTVYTTKKESKGNETLSVLAKRSEAVLAINGDLYRHHATGIIIRNGELLRSKSSTRHLLIVDANGDLSMKTDRKNEPSAELAQELLAQGVWQTFEFGPALIQDGQVAEIPKGWKLISTRDSRLEPRTAIGQIGERHYVIIVADGRKKGYSEGMTFPKLRELFLSFNAITAFNLDGGGSSEMCFMGEPINRPASGGERVIYDMIYFK